MNLERAMKSQAFHFGSCRLYQQVWRRTGPTLTNHKDPTYYSIPVKLDNIRTHIEPRDTAYHAEEDCPLLQEKKDV